MALGLAQGLRLGLAWRGRSLASWLSSIGALLWGSDHLVDRDGDTLN